MLAVLVKRQQVFAKPEGATCPNPKKWRAQLLEKNGSSGMTRSYNPPGCGVRLLIDCDQLLLRPRRLLLFATVIDGEGARK